MSPQLLADYGRSCGHVLARAHARTGDRIAIAGYLGGGDAADIALTLFAEAYADQNQRDHAALRDAVADGRIVAEPATP
jgi:thiamine monophosphate kinase